MGVSTNGQLWYGVVFEDGYEFPWDAEPFDGDEREWWRAERGFDEAKGYPAEGWLEYQKAFDAEHPCPVETVNYCSGDYPMYGHPSMWSIKLTDAIDQVLKARDERAAKIADAVVADIDSIPEPTAHAYGKRTAGLAIAAAIRKGVAMSSSTDRDKALAQSVVNRFPHRNDTDAKNRDAVRKRNVASGA